MNKTYLKINGIFKRDQKGKFLFGEFSDLETEKLKDFTWIGTEKIDGTNTRIIWDGENVEVRGKKDNSQITPYIKNATEKYLDKELFKKVFGNSKVFLFGESYGQKIQTIGNKYLPNSNDFILFDVMIDNTWLTRESVNDIAENLKIKSVPVLFKGTIQEAIKKVTKGFESTLAKVTAEGLVLVPECDLLKRNGDRIITKIKFKDFKNLI